MTQSQTNETAPQADALSLEVRYVYTAGELVLSGVLDETSGPALEALFVKHGPIHGKHLLVRSDTLDLRPGGADLWLAAVDKHLPGAQLYYAESHLSIIVYFSEDSPVSPKPICFCFD